MKKVFTVFAICFFVLSFSFSEALNFDQLKTYLEDTYLEPMAKDIGSVLAGNMFHSGRNLGFPGFDVGFGLALSTKPNKDNKILRESFGTQNNPKDVMFGLPFIQASIGLPKKIDVIVRGFPKTNDIKLFGAGVKYCIIKEEFAVVKLGLSAMYSYNSLEFETLKSNVNSLTTMFSVKIPVVEPYIGIAVDRTSLKTELSAQDLGIKTNLDVTTTVPRYIVGLNLSPLPFTYINIAGTYLVDHLGVDFGLGVKF